MRIAQEIRGRDGARPRRHLGAARRPAHAAGHGRRPAGAVTPRLLDLPRGLRRPRSGARCGAATARGRRSTTSRSPGAGGRRSDRPRAGDVTVLPGELSELAVAIPGRDGPWGVLLVVADGHDERRRARPIDRPRGGRRRRARHRSSASRDARRRSPTSLHRAEALRRVAGDIGSRLDLDRILAGLVDHAMVLFEGDRAAVFLRRPDGIDVRRGEPRPVGRLPQARCGPIQARIAAGGGDRGTPAAVRGRTTATIRAAPTSAPRSSRRATTRSARRRSWTAPSCSGCSTSTTTRRTPGRPTSSRRSPSLATQASVAIRTAQNFQQMATWTAQLQSIQQLGRPPQPPVERPRDRHWPSPPSCASSSTSTTSACTESQGADLVPVAMQGQVGEYVDETPDQLRVAVGEGITGWVAENRVAQYLPDAAADPRANTIPGTEDDLDESMLLAPMLFEDQVLGVLVLSKLGLAPVQRRRPAAARHLRELRRPGDGQRRHDPAPARAVDDPRAPAAQPARAAADHRVDPHDARWPGRARGHHRPPRRPDRLRQRRDRGRRPVDRAAHAADGSRHARGAVPRAVGARARPGVATWVVEHNEPVYIDDETTDDRGSTTSASVESADGSLIVVPLRGRMRRHRRPDHRAAGHGQHVRGRGVRPRQAVRGAGVDRPPERGGVPRRRDPRPDRRPDRACSTTRRSWSTWSALVREGAPFGLIMLDLDDFREINNSERSPGRRRGRCAGSPRRSSGPAATPTSSSATAATSSPSCCRRPIGEGALAGRRARPCRGRGLGGPCTASIGVGELPGRRRDGRPRCCWPPTARASSPSATVAIASPRRPRASRSRRSSGCRPRRRSTPRPPAAELTVRAASRWARTAVSMTAMADSTRCARHRSADSRSPARSRSSRSPRSARPRPASRRRPGARTPAPSRRPVRRAADPDPGPDRPDPVAVVRPADADARCRRSSSTSSQPATRSTSIARRTGRPRCSLAFWNRRAVPVAGPGLAGPTNRTASRSAGSCSWSRDARSTRTRRSRS